MADYSIIADISTVILQYLREKLCPLLITSPNQIDAAVPAEQDQDYILGLYLYDLQEEGMLGVPAMRRYGQGKLKKIPKSYALYYTIFVNASSQTSVKALDGQKIIGKCAQIMGDLAVLKASDLQPWLEEKEPPIAVVSPKMELEDKVRVWQAVDKPYRNCLFYKVSPVLLSSEVVLDITRVREARFSLEEQEKEERHD